MRTIKIKLGRTSERLEIIQVDVTIDDKNFALLFQSIGPDVHAAESDDKEKLTKLFDFTNPSGHAISGGASEQYDNITGIAFEIAKSARAEYCNRPGVCETILLDDIE